MQKIITILLIFVSIAAYAQQYTSTAIFSHNDYAQKNPFNVAYAEQVGYIEADIFLVNDQLLVAHNRQDLDPARTLDALYLVPIRKKIAENGGQVYADGASVLTLMIDLKSAGVPTLNRLVSKLREYPELIACKTFRIAVSGAMPELSQWNEYPSFIYFDGRPGVDYTAAQLDRVAMISSDFNSYSSWNGKGMLVKKDFDKIVAARDAAHAKGKKVRFWGSPDGMNAWITFMNLNIDILNTDHVSNLAKLLKTKSSTTYQAGEPHPVYTPKYVFRKKPKNVILMIGDGTGLAQWYSGFTANRGKLNVFQIKDIGLSVTTSSDSYITDSASGATAMSSGKKTNNRFIGVDSAGNRLALITDRFKKNSFNVGIISNGDITDATPASFYAHQPDRSMSEPIANDFMSSGVDILIGGGTRHFTNRKDGKNLFDDLSKKGYSVSKTYSDLTAINTKRFVLLDDSAVVPVLKGRKDFLKQSLRKSLDIFSKDQKPFFIMEEGAQIDWGGHENNLPYVVTEVLDFDAAIGEAMKFVDLNGETLLIITADHETGGLSLVGGNMQNGFVYGNFSTGDHTGIMVPVFSYGPGSEVFRGVYQNTSIADKILQVLSLIPEKK